MIRTKTINNQLYNLAHLIDKLKQGTIVENNPTFLLVNHTNLYSNASSSATFDNNKFITVSKGLIKSGNYYRIKGTLAHEVGHLIDFKKHPRLLKKQCKMYDLNKIAIKRFEGLVTFSVIISILVASLLVLNIISVLAYEISLFFMLTLYYFEGKKLLSKNILQRKIEYSADIIGAKLTSKRNIIEALLDNQHYNNIYMAKRGKKNVENTLWQLFFLTDHPTTKNRIKKIKAL